MPIDSAIDPMFASAGLRAVWSPQARVQRMLDVEAALARAEAATGVVPASAVAAIATACDAALYDIAALGEAAREAGNLAIPLVAALTAEVARSDPAAARFVHWGATSQDIVDTGLVLQLRDTLELLDDALAGAIDALADKAEAHRGTLLAARTLMQHAVPTTLGLKLAVYAAALARVRRHLAATGAAAMVVSLGGAGGTLAALGGKGLVVAQALADDLHLAMPDAPWHSHRDRIVVLAAAMGASTGACAKIATDIMLMMQTEVAEAFELAAPGRGGSSTMAHKRNPVLCAEVRAAATLTPGLVATMLAAMAGEHERAAGAWQAEWIAMPQLALLAGGASERIAELAAGLDFDTARMRANLDATAGLALAESVTMALGERIGRAEAKALVETACRRAVAGGSPLLDELGAEADIARHLDRAALARLLDPASYLGSADAFTTSALAAARRDND